MEWLLELFQVLVRGAFDFDFFYNQNPNPNSPAAPILITITVLDDAGISFFADGGTVDLGAITMSSEAPVPGEGLGGAIAFDLSIEVPQLEAPRVQFSETSFLIRILQPIWRCCLSGSQTTSSFAAIPGRSRSRFRL